MSVVAQRLLLYVVFLLALPGFVWPQRVERLLTQLEGSRDLGSKVDAARLLGRIAPRRAEQALRSAALAEEPELRAAAAEALGRAKLSVDVLRSLLSDTSALVRAQAAGALALANDDASCDLLARLLSDEEPNVRAASVEALAALCGNEKVATLQGLVDDPSLSVQGAARGAIERLVSAKPEPAPHAAAAPAKTSDWLPWLLKSGEPGLSAQQSEQTLAQLETALPAGEALAGDPLLEWLARAPHDLRARIAALLVQTRAQVDSARVVSLLPNSDRALLLPLLALLRTQRTDASLVRALWPLLRHDDALVRDAAAHALARHADARTVRALGATLSDDGPLLREAVATALADALPHTSAELSGWARWRLKRRIISALGDCSEACAAQLIRAQAQLDLRYATRELARQRTLSFARRVALLRATVNDREAPARAIRVRYAASHSPMVASTALSAQLFADELDDRALIAKLEDTRWPAAPIAAFGLTLRAAPLPQDAEAQVCAHLAAARDPFTRLNLNRVLVLRKVHCGDPAEPPSVEMAPDLGHISTPLSFQALYLAGGAVLLTVSDAAAKNEWDRVTSIGVGSAWGSP